MSKIHSTKVCSKCGVKKPLDQFYAQDGQRLGRRPDCKVCHKKSRVGYYQRPDVRARAKAYHKRYNANLTPEQKIRYAATLARYNARTPRLALLANRCNALSRRPTANPITIKELLGLWEAQKGLCAITKYRITWKQGRIMPTSISLDRIDQSKGYEFGNIRLICYSVNAFRNTMTDAEMLKMAKAIVANLRL